MRLPRILLITNIPNPYRIPLFNELNQQLLAEGYALKVVFGALGYSRRQWNINLEDCEFDYIVLPSKTIKSGDNENVIFTYPQLNKLLKDEQPVAIVTNAFSIATTKLWLRNLIIPTPYIIWSGGINNKYRQVSKYRTWQRKLLVKGASGFISYGTKAKEYLVSLGADASKVHLGINTVDTKFFAQQVERLRDNTNKNKLLYLGHLTQGKRLDLLLKAIKILSKQNLDFMLYLVGDGPERKKLETLVKQLRIDNFVRFEGFKQKQDIPNYLAQSCCFLFPSQYDIWGLVLVEAMASGVASIASIHAGATSDLIQDGKTGFAMDFSDPQKVAERIKWILEHPEPAKAIGVAAQNFIKEKVNLHVSAQGFVDALLSCSNAGK
ncbi:glycosyltransferase family 4 protein [Candidatus Marithrix sp. Canyon 246]|uniref:glycosyltransferase family 4 protein n=1 Tax=Candidatus Marithrix sp. Canyon 246 TaxID=1827136 RepID=UPI00084A1479|nr:glycosyltransferase family 4 protein [Candidatus Marithrix sp. Canyon 246]